MGTLAVAACAIAIVAVGVLVAGRAAFEQLMIEHGAAVAESHEMFDDSVGRAFTAAALGAAFASLALAAILGRWLAAPLLNLRAAAHRVAEGDLRVRVAPKGPDEIVS